MTSASADAALTSQPNRSRSLQRRCTAALGEPKASVMSTAIPPPTAEAIRASHDITAIIGRMQRMARKLVADDPLSGAQISVLLLLDRTGAATASALAAVEGVRPQSMVGILNALEQRKLIKRRTDPSDGRRQVVTLSAAGKASLRGRTAQNTWLATRIRDELSLEETQLLIAAAAILDRLTRPS